MDFVQELGAQRRDGPVDGRKLGEMMLTAGTAAENYRALARCFRGWQAECLTAMAREAAAQQSCLCGIRALVTGDGERRGIAAPPDTGTITVRLKKAYVRAMRLLAACEAWAEDREYGPVFQRLAARHLHLAEEKYPAETAPLLETCYREMEDYKMAYFYACKQR